MYRTPELYHEAPGTKAEVAPDGTRREAPKLAAVLHRFPVVSETFIWRSFRGLSEAYPGLSLFSLGTPRTRQPALPAELGPLTASCRRLPRRLPRLASWPTEFAKSEQRWTDTLRERVLIASDYNFSALKDQFPLVHCHFGSTGLKAIRARERGDFKGTVITSFYGFDLYRTPTLCGRNVYRELFEKGEVFLVPCLSAKHRLTELGCAEAKVRIVPLPVDIVRLSASSLRTSHSLNIVSACRLVEKKALSEALEAFALAIKEIEVPVVYRIVGDGPLRSSLVRQARRLGLSDKVHFEGWKTPDETAQILGQSDLLLHPTRRSANGDEDITPTAILEALASGLLVVTNAHPGIEEMTAGDPNSLLARSCEPQDLAEALLRGLRTEKDRVTPRRASDAIRERHDLSSVVRQLQEIYRQAQP